MIFRHRVIPLQIKIFVFKIDICYSFIIHLWFWIAAPVALSTSAEFLELHNVLCQCASFVREDVIHHSQFLVEIARLSFGGKSLLWTINQMIRLYELALEELDHF